MMVLALVAFATVTATLRVVPAMCHPDAPTVISATPTTPSVSATSSTLDSATPTTLTTFSLSAVSPTLHQHIHTTLSPIEPIHYYPIENVARNHVSSAINRKDSQSQVGLLDNQFEIMNTLNERRSKVNSNRYLVAQHIHELLRNQESDEKGRFLKQYSTSEKVSYKLLNTNEKSASPGNARHKSDRFSRQQNSPTEVSNRHIDINNYNNGSSKEGYNTADEDNDGMSGSSRHSTSKDLPSSTHRMSSHPSSSSMTSGEANTQEACKYCRTVACHFLKTCIHLKRTMNHVPVMKDNPKSNDLDAQFIFNSDSVRSDTLSAIKGNVNIQNSISRKYSSTYKSLKDLNNVPSINEKGELSVKDDSKVDLTNFSDSHSTCNDKDGSVKCILQRSAKVRTRENVSNHDVKSVSDDNTINYTWSSRRQIINKIMNNNTIPGIHLEMNSSKDSENTISNKFVSSAYSNHLSPSSYNYNNTRSNNQSTSNANTERDLSSTYNNHSLNSPSSTSSIKLKRHQKRSIKPETRRRESSRMTRRSRRRGRGKRRGDRRNKGLSLWIDSKQVKTFSGYVMEIFVIHNSRVLSYILDPNFEEQLPVIPAQVAVVNFTWRAGSKKYLYSFDDMYSQDEGLLAVPTLSLPPQGRVPRRPRVFSIGMQCTGNASGVTTFGIGLSLYTQQGRQPLTGTPLRLRLRKECNYMGPDPECDEKCDNGGVCDDGQRCVCAEGYMGPYCSAALCYPRCMNGGICTSPGRCLCPPGFNGRHCEGGICQHKCQNGGKCVQKDTCECRRGYYGNQCEFSKCVIPCVNGGRCRDVNKCRCPHGFTGDHCEVMLSPRPPTSPPTSPSTTASRCHRRCRNGTCRPDSTCHCERGYTGRWCRRRTTKRNGKQKKKVWV